MSLVVGCPRCRGVVTEHQQEWACVDHGPTPPLWRPGEASYESFTAHLGAAGTFPTYVPWPMGPDWQVSDFAVVGASPEQACATMACTSGTSRLDGPVDVFVVTEEAGTGLGSRVAGTGGRDPGPEVRDGTPVARVRLGRTAVPLWVVSAGRTDEEFDRFVVVGEAEGRWLWIVLRPASAVLLLRDEWILRDLSGLGPLLVDTRFGGPRPPW
ncbi:DUF6758 family protein [uncultured Nocardioides sp.]|uniref:DUF6758 family protein n=1 Tax=uncultured Nocardioides sp. TaxID=198441 RepID=UPI0025D84966|nr:DUF6758 family protein [uncultured Nocardioides sp.]